jgi:hypothetical protein
MFHETRDSPLSQVVPDGRYRNVPVLASAQALIVVDAASAGVIVAPAASTATIANGIARIKGILPWNFMRS